MLPSDGAGGIAPSDGTSHHPLKHTDVSQGALMWAAAGCSPRKTKAHSGKLQMALRWKTHGVGLSQFQHGCQISLMTADILKCHSSSHSHLHGPSACSCWSLGERWATTRERSNLTSGAHQLPAAKRNGEEVFLFTAINAQRAGILCADRLLDAALRRSRSEEQIALDTANESLWAG